MDFWTRAGLQHAAAARVRIHRLPGSAVRDDAAAYGLIRASCVDRPPTKNGFEER